MSYPVVVSAYAAFLEKLDYLKDADLARVEEAFEFAAVAHSGQFRSSGDPYITHPIAVAEICATWKLDAEALMAALMHDAMEDCGVTRDDIARQFGDTVAELVDGLTKLDKLHFNSREENQAESFRKMLLAMARDVRVILVKLADRTHNMRTMSDMPRSKWGRISTETMEIHVPIANRLGINRVYRELQDLAFKHLYPWRHDTLVKALGRSRNRRKEVVQKIHAEVDASFAKSGIKIRLGNQEKTLYSIYKKMDAKHLSFAQVTDSYAVRVIVPNLIDCYTALGVLHQVFRPVPSKFRDYIANPKSNGYQSLHTTLVGPSGVSMDFQIRTEDMNLVDENGVLTHWMIQARASGSGEQLGTKWVQSLLDIQDETRDAHEFWDNVRVDLFPDSVYVFTPKNQMLTLPRGATVLDFAYAIHSNVGEHTSGARINNEQVPLSTVLKSGDIVEVTTSPEAVPHPSWLTIVRTGRAKSKIRYYLKTQGQSETAVLGERLLLQALRAEGISQLPEAKAAWDGLLERLGARNKAELFSDIGQGKRIAVFAAKQMVELLAEQGMRPDAVLLTQERYKNRSSSVTSAVVLDGGNNAAVKYAKCCRPVPGDSVAGYLDRNAGLIVHNSDCAVCKKLLSKDAERFVEVEWADEPKGDFETGVVVTIINGKGVLGKIAAEIAALGSDITHITMDDEVAMNTTELKFVLVVSDRQQVEHMLRQLVKLSYVSRAYRILPTA
ncbi:RelA/SpoT family protein [Comamonas odontotermitis]|nr:bifunctional (p)ppGpp synthetase/guanosine-3',5'-bis(diphosphate) 3'-pyrophosphohydrolase [Comamonas odontotermitis]UBB19002.1 bifunctional (p)ppGpp synthetase/guanosine-3',5'-bis(diphosphate) 3'-pyrophosphohydrolase [Comamonas odontotermitis]